MVVVPFVTVRLVKLPPVEEIAQTLLIAKHPAASGMPLLIVVVPLPVTACARVRCS